MNDKEMLEQAAKAAGVKLKWDGDYPYYLRRTGNSREWNPLADDGDAFTLAVKLSLSIAYDANDNGCVNVTVYGNYDDYTGEKCIEEFEHLGYAETRRAIVRAAAEIGRSMK